MPEYIDEQEESDRLTIAKFTAHEERNPFPQK